MLYFRPRVTQPGTSLVIAIGVMSLFVSCDYAGKPVPVVTSDTISDTVTYARDIAPIINQHCAPCHRAGESAPFELTSYDEVRKRAGQIAEVTASRFMPPWLPTEGEEVFIGARRLSEAQIDMLARWAEQGAPLGESTPLPISTQTKSGWQLGEPDLIIESPDYVLPAGGGDEFRNFVLPTGIDSPRWVRAVELRPGNPQVMHHARLGVDNTGESTRRDAEDPQPGYEGMAWDEDPDGQLVTWQPGLVATPSIPGTAWRVLPQTNLVLHLHMQPTGKPETVSFQIGLYFAESPPLLEPVVLRIGNRNLDIPANDSHYTTSDEYVLPVDVRVHSIFPHAHSLCRQVRLSARYADGTLSTLLSIEDFDENWHDTYRFKEPLVLPQSTTLIAEFTYDNSSANVRNRRNPPDRVVYGSQAVDEMSDIYLQVTAIPSDRRAVLVEDYQQYEWKSRIDGYQSTLKLYPNDPWSYEGLAAAFLGLRQPNEAIVALEKRLAIPPQSVHAVISLGMAQLEAGDTEKAATTFHDALEMDRLDGMAWLGLGQTQEIQGHADHAIESYRRAVELANGLVDARLRLANLLVRAGQLQDAKKILDETIEISPQDPAAYLKRAEISGREKRYDDCLRDLELAQLYAPYLHPPKVLLAVYYMQNHEADRAYQTLVEANEETPENPVIELFLGQFAMRWEQWEQARDLLELAASRPLPFNWPASHRDRFQRLLHQERETLDRLTRQSRQR